MKKIRVRVAIAMNEEGSWYAVGSSLKTDYNSRLDAREALPWMVKPNHHVVFVEALVPLPPELPAEIVVKGRVK